MRIPIKRLLSLLFALCLVVCFSVRLSPGAAAADTVIQKILTTISATPVALQDPSTITAATSTPGLSVTSAGWFDASGKAVSGAFNPETYKLEIHVKADDGYVIASDVAAYLNNSTVSIQVENGGKTATVTREYTAAVWAPTIIKNPTGETVKEGGWASFAVSANYARDYDWYVESADGRQAIPVDNLHLIYENMSATGNGSTRMNLYNIPYELNGWKVVCFFIGAGDGNSVKSQGAQLTVIPTVSRVEAPKADTAEADSDTVAEADTDDAGNPDAAAAEEASAEAVSQTEDTTGDIPLDEMPSTAPDPVYSEAWSSDARSHWHDSENDDSRAQEELHSFVWYEAEDGTQTGVCDVCGYTLTRKPADTGSQASGSDAGSGSSSDNGSGSSDVSGTDSARSGSTEKPGAAMILLMALVPVDIALVAVHAVRSGRKPRRAEL